MNLMRLLPTLALFLAMVSLKAELLNGSFETNGLNGWEVYECGLIGLYPGAPVTARAWGVDGVVAARFPVGSVLRQKVLVQPEGHYTLGFFFACINDDTRSMLGVSVSTPQGKTLASSGPVQDPCGLGPDGFHPHSLPFIVPNNVSVVSIQFVSYSFGRGAFAVDAVTLDGPPSPPQPSLQILSPASGILELRWPISAISFKLQMLTSLTTDNVWHSVDVKQATNEGRSWSWTTLMPKTNLQAVFRLSAAPLLPIEN